jgi:hypothetical protein
VRLTRSIAPVAIALLATASAGQAAQRFAAPNGEGEACTQQAPCGLKTAIVEAKANDEVIVAVGTYPIAEPILPPEVEGLDIHGELGGPMPTVTTSTGGKILIVSGSTSLRYLEIVDTASLNAIPLVCAGSVDRVRVLATGTSALAAEIGNNCKARDSVFRADGAQSFGVFHTGIKGTALMRNVTAIATGAESVGVLSRYQSTEPGAIELDLKNVIARGDETDLRAMGNTHGTTEVAVSNSNFATSKVDAGGAITAGAGDQTAPPLFVNAAGGDYREAAGSPTIDAGVADQLGALDLAGNPRVLGTAPDIGAFEFVPPPAGGGVRTIRIKPKKFRARRSGGPVAGSIGKSKPPVGAVVTYTMTGPAMVEFSVSRAHKGRLVGRHCVKRTRSNAGDKECTYFTPVKGVFTRASTTGSNHFVFSGRIGGKTLKPGRYKLTALAGHLISAAFTIVR